MVKLRAMSPTTLPPTTLPPTIMDGAKEGADINDNSDPHDVKADQVRVQKRLRMARCLEDQARVHNMEPLGLLWLAHLEVPKRQWERACFEARAAIAEHSESGESSV